MADKLQYNLLNMEVIPPSGSWEKLSKTLDAEYDVAEIILSKKLHDFEIEPPASSFPYILLEIQPEVKSIPRSTGWRKISIAALVIGIIGLSAILLIQGGTGGDLVPQASLPVTAIPQKPSGGETLAVVPSTPVAATEVTGKDRRVKSKRTTRLQANNRPASVRRNNYISQVSYADPRELPLVNSKDPNITVAAPLIRDASGKIIMDFNLIASADNDYISITSPSGQQTRISKKFLNLLHYLNSSVYSEDGSVDAAEWRRRFDEWRNRLLEQAAFVPTATNFMDIFELKEMIQDK